MSELDEIVKRSLRSFYLQDVCSEWCGRENEMVNLYALGHLAKEVRPGTILDDLTQIGIEVAVRQLDRTLDHTKRRSDVRKDLVIWCTPKMTHWKGNIPQNEPLAVMEWKVNHSIGRRAHPQNRRDHQADIEWLLDTSRRSGMENFIGYAVLVENTRSPKELVCVRVQNAVCDAKFLTLPEGSTHHGLSGDRRS